MRKLLVALSILFALSSPVYGTNYCNDASIMGCWLVNEGTGTVLTDSSANGRNLNFKASGEPAWTAAGPTAYSTTSVDFDNTNDYVQGGDYISANMAEVSACAWVYFDAADDDDAIISEYGSSTTGFKLFRDESGAATGRTDCFRADTGNVTTDYRVETATNSAPAGAWIHVCMTFSSTDDALRVYVNGTEDANSPHTGGSGLMINPSNNLFIGALSTTGANTMMNGKIAEVATFSRKLTASEVLEIYNYGLTGSGAPAASTTKIMVIEE